MILNNMQNKLMNRRHSLLVARNDSSFFIANSANAMVLMIYFSNFRQLTINEDIENIKYLYSCSQCDYG